MMDFSHLTETVPLRDWLIISGLFTGIVILIGLSEMIRRRLAWPEEFTRKLVHILVGMLMFFIPILLRTSLPMILIAAFFTIANWVALEKGMLKGMHGVRKSYGTVFYPLSFLILVLLAWPDHTVLIIVSMMVLALGDAAAAIVGESIKAPHEYRLIADRKSLEGSFTMFVVSGLVIFLILRYYPFNITTDYLHDPLILLWVTALAALIVTASEALSSKGSDNLTIPLFTGLTLYFLLNHSLAEIRQFTLGTTLGGIAALFSYRFRLLNSSGAVAMFLLAAIIFGFGGWQWTVPILAFFILSSLLSKTGKAVKSRYDLIYEKGSRRDYAQVLANGGVAGMLMILYMFFEAPSLYFYYLAALAAATADTWATEIGTLAKQQPRLITTMQPVPTGTSGGVTIAGLLSAFAGGLVIALSGWFFLEQQVHNPLNIHLIWIIAASGLLASLFDSYLGATAQAQYRCRVCQNITEKKTHCNNAPTEPVSGVRWINNDVVNFFNTASAVIFLYGGLRLLGV